MELHLAALSTYATEANGVNMVLTGNRALGESLNRDVPPVLDSLESAVRDYDAETFAAPCWKRKSLS